MNLLWPRMMERSARQNLRQTIYHLRKNLPEVGGRPTDASGDAADKVPLIVTNRQTIRLHPAADVEVDVVRFEALLAGTQSHDHVDLRACHFCQHDLEQAMDLYRGDFLANFYLDDSNDFEEWAQAKRAYYRRRALDALEILTTIATGRNDYGKAQEYADRQLAIDNLRESAYRQSMEVLALAGRREEALALYDNCRRLFADELGMAPSARTTEIYEKILAGDLSFDSPVAQGVRGYELKDEVGHGAHGAIHRAIQPSVGREVAIKVIRRRYANDPEFIRRFEAEAQIVARLEHPHIVPLYDYWRDPAGAYVVMRLLKGGSLLSALESGPWNLDMSVKMLDQVAAALASAHKQGVIHRDIKPANILLDEEGNAYLSDFGIAKSTDIHGQLTTSGAIIGTPDYISPEQILNEHVGPTSDIYSLGAVLYETLTGEKPFPDTSVGNLIYKHLNEAVPPITASQPDLPSQVDAVIQRATAKRPADRYASAQELAQAFRDASSGSGPGFAYILDTVPKVSEPYSPYKGLRAFQEADADDFFGRDALIEQLASRLTDSRFLALVGPSGSGKSSAVKAGLIPVLRESVIPSKSGQASSEKWFVAEMAPGNYPLEELEVALWPIAVNPPPSLVEPMQHDTRGMLRTLRRILPDEEGAQLLLVIDQFEELFTLVDDEERRSFFIDSLLTAVKAPRSPLRVIITLRADFYDRPLQYESLGQLLKQNTEVILPLTSEELAWAIREPARRVGVSLDEGLAEAIVADVSDQPGSLPLMQYALTELFERRQEKGRRAVMTTAAYEEIGGVLGALGRRAEDIYSGLDEDKQEGARQLFLRLVTLGEGVEDTRRRVLRSEIEAIDEQSKINDKQLMVNDLDSPSDFGTEELLTIKNSQFNINHSFSSVIDAYGIARLLTFDRDPVTRGPTVEVAHEALLRDWGRLRRWLDESRNDLRLQRLLAGAAAEWQAAKHEDGYLLRGSRLEQFASWAVTSTLALTLDERNFLEASIAAQEERLAEEEARRQKELQTAQRLAEAEHARAEEQSQAAKRLRRRAVYLGAALAAAVVLIVLAAILAQQSSKNAAAAQENANIASTREAEAVLEAEQRAIAQAQAEEQAQLAFSRELAAASLNNLDADPELSILLALQALSVTETLEAEHALHQAVRTSRVRQTLVPPGDLRSMNVMYSPDGRRLWTNGEGGGAMYDLESGTILYEIPSSGWIKHAEFSPDGSLLALPEDTRDSEDPQPGTVTIVDAQSGDELLTFIAHDSFAQFAAFSPDGRQLATTGGSEVRLWDLTDLLAGDSPEPLLDLEGHEEIVWMARYSPDGKRLATGGDRLTFVWDTETGEQILKLETTAYDVLFSPDGTILLTAYDKVVEAWDMKTGQKVFNTPAHATTIESMRLSPDGTTVATMGFDGKANSFAYSNDGLQERLTLNGHGALVETGDFSPDGDHLATGSADGTVRIWDITANGSEESFVLEGHDDWVREVSFSPDGRYLATASRDGTARLWDAQNGRLINTLSGLSGQVNHVAFGQDGRIMAMAGEDPDVILRDIDSDQQTELNSGHGAGNVANLFSGVIWVDFSSDGDKIATAGADGLVKVFDVQSGQELLTVAANPQEGVGATIVAFSPDNRRLATASDTPGLVKIWDVNTGQELYILPAEFRAIWGLTFSPDGAFIGVSDLDGMLSMWQLGDDVGGTEAPAAETSLLFETKAHNATASGLSISPDGSLLATASPEGTVKVWDSSTGQALLTFEFDSGMTGTAFSPDGRYLAASGFDGLVHILVLDSVELTELAQSRVTRSLTDDECQQYLHVDSCPPNMKD